MVFMANGWSVALHSSMGALCLYSGQSEQTFPVPMSFVFSPGEILLVAEEPRIDGTHTVVSPLESSMFSLCS